MIREEKGQSETVVLFFDFFEGGHHLEIKINREIREYTEAMYFGLSPRQFICAALACGVAVGLYFLLRPHMGMETVS